MTTRYYFGVAEPGPSNWSISFPAFPGVVTVADSFSELARHARDALASAIDALQAMDTAIPDETTDIPAYDPSHYREPRIMLVPAEIQGRSVRIDVTLEDDLVTRLDRLAEQSHASRSDLLARGARLVLAAEQTDLP